MKKISIIIPVYNVEKYIEQCLNSVINQTHKEIEVILIDDGSSDASGIICDEYAKKDNRIKVIHQNNSGVAIARNKGLSLIKGDYVMFIDPDDWIELNTCEVLMNEIGFNDIIIFNHIKEYGNKSVFNSSYYNIDIKDIQDVYKLQAHLLNENMNLFDNEVKSIGFACNKIIRYDLIKNMKFPLEGKKAIFEDVLFNYALFEKTKKIKLLNQYLYHYRIIKNSATRKFNDEIIEINDEIYKYLIKYKQNHQCDKFYNQSLDTRMLNNFIHELTIYICNPKSPFIFLEKKQIIKKELNKQQYSEAIKNVKLSNLSFKQKVYAILLKLRLISLVILTNKLERIIKRR